MPVARLLDPDLPLLFLPEGPVWDPDRERLLWVEIRSGQVFDAALADGGLADLQVREFDSTVGAVLLADDGGLVVAGARHVHYFDPSGEIRRSIRVIDDGAAGRLNDATVDPRGRVLVGTAPASGVRDNAQRVVSIDLDGTVRTVLSGLCLANGMDFSRDERTLFAVDSIPGRILKMDYDVQTGEVGPASLVWSGPELADGLTVDSEGRLWVAFFGTGQVRCLDVDGRVLEVIDLPAPHPTCPVFFGPALDRLLVTTAQEKLTDEQLRDWPQSGGLFTVDVGAIGLPPRRVRTNGAV